MCVFLDVHSVPHGARGSFFSRYRPRVGLYGDSTAVARRFVRHCGWQSRDGPSKGESPAVWSNRVVEQKWLCLTACWIAKTKGDLVALLVRLLVDRAGFCSSCLLASLMEQMWEGQVMFTTLCSLLLYYRTRFTDLYRYSCYRDLSSLTVLLV